MRGKSQGYTLIEVLVSLAILLVGVLSIIYFYPKALESRNESELVTVSSLLAQLKASEILRDDDTTGTLVTAIQNRTEPTDPMVFPQDERLSYAFSGRSLLYDAATPEGQDGVARVIVFRTKRPTAAVRPQDVWYELRFR